MIESESKNLEVAGKEAYERLKKIWGLGSPYGEDLQHKIVTILTSKMMESVEKRVSWLIDELKLNIAQKGMFDFEGQPRGLAVRLLAQTSLYGAEDYIPLLNAVFEISGEDMPQEVRIDIELVRDWMKQKYDVNIV